MDLQDFLPKSDTITVLLKNKVTDEYIKKDDGTEMSITLYLPHTKEYKAVIHEQTNKRIQRAQKNKKLVFTAEEIDNASVEVLAKTTKTWDIQINKKNPKFSVADAMELYQKFSWIKDQLLEEQEAYTDFLKA